MSVKKTQSRRQNQEHISRTVIAEQLVQMFGSYKIIVSSDHFEKAVKKASKHLSKVVVLPSMQNHQNRKLPLKSGKESGKEGCRKSVPKSKYCLSGALFMP